MNATEHISRACSAAGGQAELARQLGVSPAAVAQWRSGRRPLPIRHVMTIERATAGAVTRRDLRPDDAHLIWPDLAESEPNTPPAPADQAQAAINKEAIEGAA